MAIWHILKLWQTLLINSGTSGQGFSALNIEGSEPYSIN